MKIEPITVTQLNKHIKEKFEEDEMLNAVLVKGEISNFKHHYTGHMYFTLKDETSLIKCVMFKTQTGTLNFTPRDGMKVLVFGAVSVFERDGQYQIYCKAMQEDGVGSLYKAYEELKQKLEKQGLFDSAHKKKIPVMPKVIGVLTSQTGSVVKDIINVSTRRNPNVYLRILPIPVQGEGAAERIVKAIEYMNKEKLADVLILARGGGSLEDLWPFNEEIVAHAIYESNIPIISAIGHETDFTISDFVSDLRAPTPSAAAELSVPNVVQMIQMLENYNNRYKQVLRKKLEYMNLQFEKCMSRAVFTDPYRKINDYYQILDNIMKNMEYKMNNKLKEYRTQFVENATRLDGLSPLKTLTRGYCISEKDGKVLKSKKNLKKQDEFDVRFTDGIVNVMVK